MVGWAIGLHRCWMNLERSQLACGTDRFGALSVQG